MKKINIYLIIFTLQFNDLSKIYSQNTAIDSLLRVLKTTTADTVKLNTLNKLSLNFWKVGNYDSSIYYADKSIELGLKTIQSNTIKKKLAYAYVYLSNAYRNKSDYPPALKYLYTALKIQVQINDQQGLAITYNSVGLINERQGNYIDALKNHFLALKIRETINDKKEVAISYNNIANIYLHQKKLRPSL